MRDWLCLPCGMKFFKCNITDIIKSPAVMQEVLGTIPALVYTSKEPYSGFFEHIVVISISKHSSYMIMRSRRTIGGLKGGANPCILEIIVSYHHPLHPDTKLQPLLNSRSIPYAVILWSFRFLQNILSVYRVNSDDGLCACCHSCWNRCILSVDYQGQCWLITIRKSLVG